MERLTKRFDDTSIGYEVEGDFYSIAAVASLLNSGIDTLEEAAYKVLKDISDRLADYEDIGLTPDQIREVDKLYSELCKELGAYKKLEEQGLLLRLPCKVGDTIYVIPSKANYDLNILNGHKEDNRVYTQVVNNMGIYKDCSYTLVTCEGMRLERSESYKETWFLDKTEAEQALVEMQKEMAEEAIPEAEYEKPNPAEGAVIRHRPTKEELARDLSNGLMAIEIAKKYGYKSPSFITTLMRKYGLIVKGKKGVTVHENSDKAALMEFIEGRIDEVKALYTNGPFTLEKLAVEYSADKRLLHEVLGAKGLLKGKNKLYIL